MIELKKSETERLLAFLNKIQTQKRLNECLFNTDTQDANFGGNLMPTIFQAPNKLQKLNQNKISLFLSFFIVFNHLSVL